MRRLLLVLLLLPALASAAALSKLRVVDSAGKTVGYVVDNNQVIRREQGVYVQFGVWQYGVIFPSPVPHVFESEDCTGQPLLRNPGNLVKTSSGSVVPGQIEFGIGTPQDRTVRSSTYLSQPCTPFGQGYVESTQAIGTLDLGQFVPPFRIK